MSESRNETVRRLFAEAMERAPEERAAWLDRACGGDADLRREVASLIGALDAHGDVLRQALDGLPDAAGAFEPASGGGEALGFEDDLVGREVAHYRLVERLGGGGMGVVYKALDTRLGRTVALKFLPSAVTRDPEVKRRFVHEARAASMLDHPRICTVHEIGESADGRLFIVMAYVEGETLKQKIARRPLPIDEAIDITAQTARGLAAAHQRGIVHRDVKPANLLVTSSGEVKIVDFGLAKTADVQLTRTGTTLGTIAYMSPEQVRGEAVDRRTDIWALGVVLYEMLTGRRPFEGARPEIVAQTILAAEPEPVTALRSGVPLALDDILAKMLAKDPADRYQHADELPVDLRAVGVSGPGPPRPPRRVAGRWKPVSAGLLAGLLLAAGVGWWQLRRPATEADADAHAQVVRFEIALEHEQTLTSGAQPVALSPDGRRVVYSARQGREMHLYQRRLDRLEATAIPGTEGGHDPFFSPDGRWIGFFADGKLMKVQAGGGIPQVVCGATQPNKTASWGLAGDIVMSVGVTSGLLRVSAAGGEPEVLTVPDNAAGEIGHSWPRHLPDGRHVLFTVWDDTPWRTAVLDLDTGARRVLLDDGAAARYSPTGHLVFAQMSRGLPAPGLLAVPFDADRLEVTGSPVSVIDLPGLDGPNFDVSDNGTLVYVAEGAVWTDSDGEALVRVDRTGDAEPMLEKTGSYDAPRFSPDGTHVAVAEFTGSGTYDIWVYDVAQSVGQRLTNRGHINTHPVWSPDGEWIAFNSARQPPGIYRKRADGVGEAELLVLRKQHLQLPSSWSPDGATLLYTELHPQTRGDLWLAPLDGEPAPLLATPNDESSPRLPPNGRALAYVSDATGQAEVYVRLVSEDGPAVRVSAGGGREPVWAPDGRTLFYRWAGTMWAAAVTSSSPPEFGSPERLFVTADPSAMFGYPGFDVAPDGRFLMVRHQKQDTRVRLHVVTNWFSELTSRVSDGS